MNIIKYIMCTQRREDKNGRYSKSIKQYIYNKFRRVKEIKNEQM